MMKCMLMELNLDKYNIYYIHICNLYKFKRAHQLYQSIAVFMAIAK